MDLGESAERSATGRMYLGSAVDALIYSTKLGCCIACTARAGIPEFIVIDASFDRFHRIEIAKDFIPKRNLIANKSL